ncbi:YpsA SLOG family protein [Demequina sp.]|uniref:YpsA SLOG family protein n=1 Tax=Demequina sp. TaxID=2050685 RepID=UPI003A87A07B
MAAISRIVSGGQTGVDRAALDAAIAARVVHGGWCPAAGWAEDKPYAPGVLVDYPGLKPTQESDPHVRTRLNVRDAHVTVVLTGGMETEGTQWTLDCAATMRRPIVVDPTSADALLAALDGIGTELIVNVAGPRASTWPEGYETARALMASVLERDGNDR